MRFECVRTTMPAPAPTPPSQSYTYRTDQELVQASQTASASCPKPSSRDDVEHRDQFGWNQDRDVPMWPALNRLDVASTM